MDSAQLLFIVSLPWIISDGCSNWCRLRSDIARMSWTDVRCDTVLSPGLAQKVLGDLTHQIDLASGNMEIKFSQADGQQDSLAEKTQIDMLQAAKTSQELLRHFWVRALAWLAILQYIACVFFLKVDTQNCDVLDIWNIAHI